MLHKIIKQNLSIYVNVIVLLFMSFGHCQRKPMNISQEVQFYAKLFDEYKKLERLTTITNEVTSNAKLIRNTLNNGVYEALNRKASEEAGAASGLIDNLYNQFEKFIDNYKLPEFEDIPKINNITNLEGLSSNKQREIINIFLTELTNDAIYYNGKITDYETTSLYLKSIENAAIKLKMENHYVAKAILRYMKEGVPIPWQTAWKFHQIYAKKLSGISNKIKRKRKSWDDKVIIQRTRFDNYKSNIRTLLYLEKNSLQVEYDKIKKQIKDYNESLKAMKLEIKLIKEYEQELIVLKLSISSEEQRLNNLESISRNYAKTIRNLSRRLSRIKDWKNYKLNYRGCPNEVGYDKCTHNDERKKFRNIRKKTISKLNDDISYNKSRKKSNDNLIVKVRQALEDKRNRLRFLREEIKKLPLKESDLEELEMEVKEFFQRVDVFFTQRLLNENQRNIDKILTI
ncbi:hypothetical protein [Winogradskyella sp. R77965]|uniref:hypothetical protein n=1 Tax=Winogradskyella sp. R77965 TaxID=3093872 RepID=UPI0037DD5C88